MITLIFRDFPFKIYFNFGLEKEVFITGRATKHLPAYNLLFFHCRIEIPLPDE